MIVREDSIAFIAIPKHASHYVRTVDIPLTILEAAVVGSSVDRRSSASFVDSGLAARFLCPLQAASTPASDVA